MTHLVFLPNDGAVIVNETDESAESLAARVIAGEWLPPPPYQNWNASGKVGLRALTWGSLVLVMPVDFAPAAAQSPPTPRHTLTERDIQFLQYAAEGLSNKEIAARMSLSLRSVARQIDRIKLRLGVETRAQTIGRATQLGLVRMKKR